MKSKEEDMATQKYGKKFYFRYKGECRQREESRLNMDSRLNWTMDGERGRKSKKGAVN